MKKLEDNTNEKRDRPNAYIELPKAVKARFVKFENIHILMPNLAVSDISVFGNGGGKAPETPKNFEAKRDTDERNAFIKCEKVDGAVGCNILW